MPKEKAVPAMLYAVVTTPHNGGHGSWPLVVQVTPDPIAAIKTARTVEVLGYEIDWDQADVRVDRMTLGAILTRQDLKNNLHIIYRRRKGRIHIERELEMLEYVFEPDIAEKLGVTVALDWFKPSVPLPKQ